jgi:hypothetical protein
MIMSDKPEVQGVTEKATPQPPRFVDPAGRAETVMLDWPIEYDGKLWDRIVVRRMTVAEVSAFSDRVASTPEGERKKISVDMFDAPPEVMGAMDADDDEKIWAVANRFLPRRFRVDTQEQISETGE